MLKITVIKHSEALNVLASAVVPLIYKLQEESSCQRSVGLTIHWFLFFLVFHDRYREVQSLEGVLCHDAGVRWTGWGLSCRGVQVYSLSRSMLLFVLLCSNILEVN